jgi:hypothetical protein
LNKQVNGAVAIIAVLAAGYHGWHVYFMRTITPLGQTVADGYGREISPAPALVKMVYDLGDGLWPGPGWALVDWVAFFGLVFIAWTFGKKATDSTKTP